MKKFTFNYANLDGFALPNIVDSDWSWLSQNSLFQSEMLGITYLQSQLRSSLLQSHPWSNMEDSRLAAAARRLRQRFFPVLLPVTLFADARDWTQALLHAKNVLHYSATTPPQTSQSWPDLKQVPVTPSQCLFFFKRSKTRQPASSKAVISQTIPR